MPCHVDPIPPRANEINILIKIINGKISVKNVGDDFYGKYPTVETIVKELKNEKIKTFHYKTHGNMMIIVSPCPKKC